MSQPACVDDRLELLDVAALAMVERDLEHAAGRARGLHHRVGLGPVQRDRLLTQDVDAALQRGDGDRGVQEGGHRDADRVEAVEVQQVLPARELMLDPIARGELRADGLLQAGDRGDVRAGERVVGGDVLLAGPPQADDADAQVAGVARGAHAPPRSNHPRGASGLPGTARGTPGPGAAHSIALAITRWTSAWW